MNVWKQASAPLVVSLVTTFDQESRVNASPKTWWTPTSYDPPRLVLAVKPESDTAMNIEKVGMFALHLPPDYSDEVTRRVLHTAKTLPYGENELDDQELNWRWQSHPEADNIRFATVDGMPWFGCMVATKLVSGDHHLYEAQVVMSATGREGEDQAIESVLLHRGQNRFVHMGDTFEVERY